MKLCVGKSRGNKEKKMWKLLERKKRLKVSEEKNKEGLVRLNGRDGEFTKASGTSAVHSRGSAPCLSPVRKPEGWGRG